MQAGFDGPYLVELTMLQLLVTIHQVGHSLCPFRGFHHCLHHCLHPASPPCPGVFSIARPQPRSARVNTVPARLLAPWPQELGASVAYQPFFTDLKLLDLQHVRQVIICCR